MADKLVTIARFGDYIEAEMAKQLLADYGIKAVVTGQNLANVYGGLPALSHIELQILESQAEQARQILESQEQHETLEDEEDSEKLEDNDSFLMDEEQ